jgi:hypothetical protein
MFGRVLIELIELINQLYQHSPKHFTRWSINAQTNSQHTKSVRPFNNHLSICDLISSEVNLLKIWGDSDNT